ncbi:hypothetical protein DM860_013797 [Cuscuta australis]|uniref:RING-type E3 ubiquitin transferase n=1 Tax=Cuscuta australis TaxID=267555 RepID=A0A328DMG4_9ASTE|nr:hypothetical protein DM860_013797 [Cuscuta australis]
MSAYDQAAAAAIAQIALAADGALLGLTLAFVAVRSIFKFRATRSALHIIEEAPLVRVSDLRSLLGADKDLNQFDGGRVVIVRGTVEAKSSVEGNWKSLVTNVLVAPDSGEKAVILQRTHTVPFVIVEAGRWPQSEYVNVKLDGSMHPLPLVTVYHHLHPVNATPLTFLQALFGHQYPVGLLDEEKILPLGKEITAVGVCSSSSGTLEIKACNYLPFFMGPWRSPGCHDRIGVGARRQFRRILPENAPTRRKPPAGRSVFRPTPAKLTAGTNSNAVVASGRPPRTPQLQDLMKICKTPNFGSNFEF